MANDKNEFLNKQGLRVVAVHVNDKAGLDSPVFTGNPTAPNPKEDDDSNSIATTHYVNVLVDKKAELESPEFTGTPIAPTVQDATDSSDTIATTAFVHIAAQKEIESARHTLAFGKYSYDGSKDVTVDNYEGNYDVDH